MSDAWFESQLLPDGTNEDGCHPQEAAALKDYLRSETMTAKEAARAITLPIEGEEDPEENLSIYRLWGFLTNALKDLKDQQAKIV